MAAKELKERKNGGSKKKGLCPQNVQMDPDEAGFIRVGVNMCQRFEARRGGPWRRRKNLNKSIVRFDPYDYDL
jgi:hypothetical protein